MKGACNCGAVRVELKTRPDYINFCNCSLCSKSGAAWCYCRRSQVEISGETKGFIRSDQPDPTIELRFCPKCGTAIHWVPVKDFGVDRMAVNIRLLDPTELAGVEARFPDGRSWEGQSDYGYLRPHEIFDPVRHA